MAAETVAELPGDSSQMLHRLPELGTEAKPVRPTVCSGILYSGCPFPWLLHEGKQLPHWDMFQKHVTKYGEAEALGWEENGRGYQFDVV